MYDFDVLLDRKNTDCTKWDAIERDFGRSDLTPFWVADADFPVLPDISKAIRDRAQDGMTYGYTFAGDRFFESIIHWNLRRHHLELKKEEILPIPGVVTALALILLGITKAGDKVMINPPVYPPFYDVVKDLDRELVCSPLVLKENKYQLDFEDIDKKLTSGVKAYILCSPHNPVGRVWTENELKRLTDLCRKHGTTLISDEIHSDIVLNENKHIPILNIDENSIMVSAPSKTFNISGLKTSFVFVKNEELRQTISHWIDAMHLYINLFGLKVTTVVYEKGDTWLDEMLCYIEENAEYTLNYLNEVMPKVKTYIPESTYLMWLDFSEYHLSGEDLEKIVIDKARLALNPGTDYGEGFDQFMRLNIATPRAYLKSGLEKLSAAFAGI